MIMLGSYDLADWFIGNRIIRWRQTIWFISMKRWSIESIAIVANRLRIFAFFMRLSFAASLFDTSSLLLSQSYLFGKFSSPSWKVAIFDTNTFKNTHRQPRDTKANSINQKGICLTFPWRCLKDISWMQLFQILFASSHNPFILWVTIFWATKMVSYWKACDVLFEHIHEL